MKNKTMKIITASAIAGLAVITIRTNSYVNRLKDELKEQETIIKNLNDKIDEYEYEESYKRFCTLEVVECNE